MADRLTTLTLGRQQSMFRLAERDHGLTRKMVSVDSGIHYDTLGTYWRGEAVMPFTAFLKLVDVVPDYLLSRMLASVNRHLAPNEEGNGDLDALGREAASFTAEYVDAKSEGNVTPIERARLKEHAERLGAAADKVAAA